MTKHDLHPSGLTLERWADPWKNKQERELVLQYFRKQERAEKRNKWQILLDTVGPASL